jgi:hypothetical protein
MAQAVSHQPLTAEARVRALIIVWDFESIITYYSFSHHPSCKYVQQWIPSTSLTILTYDK